MKKSKWANVEVSKEELIDNIEKLAAENDALLEALEDIAIWWENWMPDEAYEEGGYESLEKARTAIAKARGENE